MSCEEILEIHSAWLDGEATAAELALLDEHLRTCPGCRRRADELSELTLRLRVSIRLSHPFEPAA